MLKVIFLKYYYVWFQAHKRSKYAHQFSDHWFYAFLQVCLSVSLTVIIFAFLLEFIFHINLLKLNNRVLFLCLYGLFPAFASYVLLFCVYKVDKGDDEPGRFNIAITRRTKYYSWAYFIGSFVLVMLIVAFRKTLLEK